MYPPLGRHLGGSILAFVGFQPPHELVGKFLAGTVVFLGVVWFLFERNRSTAARTRCRQAPGRDRGRSSRSGQRRLM
jgi:hypothetical protein